MSKDGRSPVSRGLGAGLRREDGVTVIEFALALPVFLLLFLGAFELSRYVWLQVKLDRVAVSLGDLVAREQSVDSSLINSVFVAASQILQPFTTGSASRVIISSISPTSATDLNPKVNWQRSGSGNLGMTSKIAPCGKGKITMPFKLGASDVVIVTETFYSFTPVTGEGIMKPSTLYHSSFFRPRIGSLSSITDSGKAAPDCG